MIFDRSTLRAVKTITLGKDSGGVVGLYWHPAINQIVYGTTVGHVHVLYDPLLSSKGVRLLLENLLSFRANRAPVGELVRPLLRTEF